MRITKRVRQAALLLILATSAVIPAYADSTQTTQQTTQPGSADDPLVTKSYVDQVLAQKSGTSSQPSMTDDQIKQLIATEVDKALKAAAQQSNQSDSDSTNTTSNTTSSMEVLQLQPGQTLMAGPGTEFIVRTGKTIAVSNDGEGIPDVTGGKDIAPGSAIDLNHLLIFPKEGRGIKPDPKGKDDIYVMVRGKYLLIKP